MSYLKITGKRTISTTDCVRIIIVIATMTLSSHSRSFAQGLLPHHGGTANESQVSAEDPMGRAGNPLCISPLARSFPESKYKGYFVGGGAACYGSPTTAFRGECRRLNEGTFGVDYVPWYSRVQTRWFHGRKQQDGEGSYEPDAYNNPLDDHLGFGSFRKALQPFHH